MENIDEGLESFDDTNLTPAQSAAGKILMRWAKRGDPKRDWSYIRFDIGMDYNPITRFWRLAGTATHDAGHSQIIRITYDEPIEILFFSVESMKWDIPKNPAVRVTINESQFRLDFVGNIESTLSPHYNIMARSNLVVAR